MPNMNGYEFFPHVSKEINVLVISMSLDHNKNTVLKVVQLGACDYWIKPLREHQFKNMRTHACYKESDRGRTRIK
ncbi:hypothetical protein JHK85_010278 [Glycine max]|nr:hypothetical protein JHK85_010278 [Glycine max]